MKNFIMLIVLFFISTNIFANEEGRLLYRKNCMSCHGDGKKGAFISTQDGWVDLFDKNAAKLTAKHANSEAKSFFASDEFKKTSKSMFEFLKEYASDSGNVAGCGSSCD